MPDRLVVAVLGNRKSGKSTTWDTLFNKKTRTMKTLQKLEVTNSEVVSVYLVSGSPQERNIPIEELLPPLSEETPTIVLCSIQYRPDVTRTIEWFVANGFDIKVVWLNPGYADAAPYPDELSLVPSLLEVGAVLSRRDANADIGIRCNEIREAVYGWAGRRGLIKKIG